jgi:glucosyltransferase
MAKEKISVIVSCYNEEESIPLFYEEINRVSKSMANLDFEYLFIDDGSKDSTLAILKGLAKKDSRVRFISFSRNFGKEAAMFAGLENATGDYITLMDADLQDPPALLPKMFEIIQNGGYDQVGTRRVSRIGEPPIRSFFARKFYKLINKMTDRIEIVDGARDYRLMTRQVVNAIISMKEYSRFSKGIFSFVGFKTKWLEYENVKRVAGETKWSFWSLFKYAIDGIIGFTVFPLALPIYIGCTFELIFLINFIIMLVKWFKVSPLFTLTTLLLLMLGIVLIAIGIMGLYLAHTYLEIKKRPIYIVRETEKGLD